MGLCLDIDGTLYRDGSVFVETLIHLPLTPDSPFSATERAQLRQAVGIVGQYQGGRMTAWRWRTLLWLIEQLRMIKDTQAARRALDRLLRLQAWVETWQVRERATASSTAEAYQTMRTALLEQHGTTITGHDRSTLQTDVASLLRDIKPIDTNTATVLQEAIQSDIDVALVTDMPEHVAQPFADAVIDAPVQTVVGTSFDTDATGRFTGSFETVDKRTAVAQLREQYGWEHVIAAGDTSRDLRMAEYADQFLAVAGQGQIRDAVDDPHVIDPAAATPPTGSKAPLVYVPSDQPFGDILRIVLGLT